jgi:hypothetical protein
MAGDGVFVPHLPNEDVELIARGEAAGIQLVPVLEHALDQVAGEPT